MELILKNYKAYLYSERLIFPLYNLSSVFIKKKKITIGQCLKTPQILLPLAGYTVNIQSTIYAA